MQRTIIRGRIRQILRETLDINRFAARTAGIDVNELPAALVYFPSESLDQKANDSNYRRLDLRIEVVIVAKNDPEDELSDLSDKLEKALLWDEKLLGKIVEIELSEINFVVEGEGKIVLAACEHRYEVSYLKLREKS